MVGAGLILNNLFISEWIKIIIQFILLMCPTERDGLCVGDSLYGIGQLITCMNC